MTRVSNTNSDESSSNWRGVYYCLLGGKKKFNSKGDREWNDLCKCLFKTWFITWHIRTTKSHHASCFKSSSIFI